MVDVLAAEAHRLRIDINGSRLGDLIKRQACDMFADFILVGII